MSSKESRKINAVATITIATAVVLLLVALGIRMFMGDSFSQTTDGQVTAIVALNCTTDTKINSFFNTDLADRVEHRITIAFDDEKPSEVSYKLSAVYDNAKSFEDEGRIWKTDYGLYMDRNNLEDDYINTTFSATNDKAQATLYTEFPNINAVTAKLFLINESTYTVVQNYDIAKLKQYYEKLGFGCKEINNEETNEK